MRGWSLWFMLVVLTPLPGAAAQATATPVLTWETPGPVPVVVPLELVTYHTTLHVDCASGSPASPGPWSIHLQAIPGEGAETLSVTLEPAALHVEVDPVACASGTRIASQAVTIEIGAAHDAEAGAELPLSLQASEPSLDEPAATQLAVPIGAFFNHQVRLSKAIHKVAPGETIDLPVVVTNHGNLDLRLTPSLAPGSSKALDPIWPEHLVVARGEEKTFRVPVATEAGKGVYENRRDTLVMDFGSSWTEDASATGESVRLTAVIQQQGSPALPSPAPLWLLLAVFAVLQIARRRMEP